MTYTAVLLGGMSLISTTFNSEALSAEWNIKIIEPRLRTAEKSLVGALEGTQNWLCETHYQKSPDSPADFDGFVREQALACQIIISLISNKDQWITREKLISIPQLGQNEIKDKIIKDSFDSISEAAIDTNNLLKKHIELNKAKKTGALEILLTSIEPYLAALGLAIALGAVAFPEKHHMQ